MSGSIADNVGRASGVIAAAGGGGKILQVLSPTPLTAVQTLSTGTTWVDITNLSQAITPSATTSRILIMYSVFLSTAEDGQTRILRDATAVGVGDARDSRTRVSREGTNRIQYTGDAHDFSFIDSPSTTSAITYKIQVMPHDSGPHYVNRCRTDSDNVANSTGCSTMILWEIGA